MIWVEYIVLGAFTGVLSGLFGLGGGIIIVPILTLLLESQGFTPSAAMYSSIATSLAVMIFTTLGSIWSHHRRGRLLWNLYFKMMFGSVVGVVVGVFCAKLMNAQGLQIIFGCFMWLVALRVVFLHVEQTTLTELKLPSNLRLNTMGGMIGFFSGLLGIGGGSLMTPLVASYGVSLPQAAGVSSMTSLVAGIAGTLAWQVVYYFHPAPASQAGGLFWGITLAVAIPALLTAPMGVRLAYFCSAKVLKGCFVTMLFLIGLQLIYRGFFH